MIADKNAEKLDSSEEKGYNKSDDKANKPIFRLNLQLFSNIDIHKQTIKQLKKEIRSYQRQIEKHTNKMKHPKNTIRIGITNQKDSKKDVMDIGEKN